MKKAFRRTVLIALTLVMLLQVPITAEAATTFPDVKSSDWFYDNVTKLVQLGIVNGMDDGLFHPDENIKRGEFMKMLMIAGESL